MKAILVILVLMSGALSCYCFRYALQRCGSIEGQETLSEYLIGGFGGAVIAICGIVLIAMI